MIYKVFSDNLPLKSDAIAIVTSTGEQLTYSMVRCRVNQWANYLVGKGIESGDRVAVLLDNEDHHVFLFLALDRINATYVPFDTDITPSQLATNLDSLNLKKIVIEDILISKFEIDPTLQLVLSDTEFMDIAAYNGNEPSRVYDTNGFAKVTYLVFSSGSTGPKKGIPIVGEGLIYWAATEKKLFEPYPLRKVLATRSPAYDARISEYVRAFAAGGELHLMDRLQRKDLVSILTACETKSIDCLLLIASQLNSENSERIVSRLKSGGLKHLMVTGDACTLQLKALGEKLGVIVWNCYGSTEETFGASILPVNHLEVKNAAGQSVVPIGKPVDPVSYRILDGRLFIISPYLTPGYIQESDNSAFQFLSEEHVRAFDTGDKFSELEGGYLLYEGRDTHCKIDGVKVTPEFSEQCINNYKPENDDTVQAAVVIKNDKLYGYLVTNASFDKRAFVTYLKEKLEPAAIPLCFSIDRFPLLSTSEKIDRPCLIKKIDQPEDRFFNDSESNSFEMESSSIHRAELLKKVHHIWCELLGYDQVPMDTEFVFLGGNSTKAVEMVGRINQHLDQDYSYIELMQLKETTVSTVVDSLLNKQTFSDDQALIKLIVFLGEEKKNIFILPDLLGEGYFSYRSLAKRLANQFDCNVYGLSDPGIVDERWLPKSMDHAVKRYVKAIQSIQPDGYRYQIVGFSFGTILAYKVAEQLADQEDFCKIELHLMDGFPPEFYQALSDRGHADLLQALINFMVVLLNKPYYGEHLDLAKLGDYSKLKKIEQIETSFTDLEKQVTNPTSKNLLNIAKRHLRFIFAESPPQQRLFFKPTLYFTNKQQAYLQVIKQIPQLSEASSAYQYYFWDRYFQRMTLCGVELAGDHLSLLQDGPPKDRHTPECFWDRDNDSVINMQFGLYEDYGPGVLYRLAPLDLHPHSDHQLSIFFGRSFECAHIADKLTRMGLSPIMVCNDQNLQKTPDGMDREYASKSNVFCRVPSDKLEEVRSIFSKRAQKNFRVNPRPTLLACDIEKRLVPQSGNLHLVVLLASGMPLLTLSFRYHCLPDTLSSFLQQQIGADLKDVSTDPVNLTFHYKGVRPCGNIYNSVFQVENFLADFISLVSPYTAEPCQTVEEILGKELAKKKFVEMVQAEFGAYLQRLPPPILEQEGLIEPDQKWVIFKAAIGYAETMWKNLSGTLSERFFAEFGHFYKHDQMNPEFRALLKEWKRNIPWSEIEDLIDPVKAPDSRCLETKRFESKDGFFKPEKPEVGGILQPDISTGVEVSRI